MGKTLRRSMCVDFGAWRRNDRIARRLSIYARGCKQKGNKYKPLMRCTNKDCKLEFRTVTLNHLQQRKAATPRLVCRFGPEVARSCPQAALARRPRVATRGIPTACQTYHIYEKLAGGDRNVKRPSTSCQKTSRAFARRRRAAPRGRASTMSSASARSSKAGRS